MTMEHGPTETEDFYTVYCTLYSTVQWRASHESHD